MGTAARTDRPTGSPPGSARQERKRTNPAPEAIPPGGDGPANGRASCLQPQVVGLAAEAVAAGERAIALGDVAGARLLVSDVRVALLLLDEARHRVVERLFGVSRDQSWPVTLIALALVAHAAHEKSDQMLRGPGGPTRSDVALGVATARELIVGISGPSSRDTPLVGTLMTVAVVGALVRPGLSRAVHGISASSRRARHSFNHRYGHLLPTFAVGKQLVGRPRRPPPAPVADKLSRHSIRRPAEETPVASARSGTRR